MKLVIGYICLKLVIGYICLKLVNGYIGLKLVIEYICLKFVIGYICLKLVIGYICLKLVILLLGGMRWVGHVARMGEGRGVHRVLVEKREGKNHWGDPDVDGRIILR